jgi:hypothetical protein
VTPLDDVVSRIVDAEPGHAAAIVLALPPVQGRAVLAALGPREVARLLIGARADRVPDLVDAVAPEHLSPILAHLQVVHVAALVPLLSNHAAVRVVQSMSPAAAAELLLALPAHQRLALQPALPQPSLAGGDDYARRVDGAVRRVVGQAIWIAAPAGSLLTEIFGRSIQITARDSRLGPFGAAELQSLVAATDWRRVAGLLVLSDVLDSGLLAGVRDARSHGYLVETLQWQDERDDGVLKRALVRLGG